MIGNIEMSVAAGTNQRTVRAERSCRPDLVTGTPSTAGNSRIGDASCGRHADAAVPDWNNAITKTEPAPGETLIDQASSRPTTLPPDISQVVLVLQGGGALEPTRSAFIRRCMKQASSWTG